MSLFETHPAMLAALAIPILPNLWSIWHIYWRDFETSTEKMIWFGLAVFVPVLGGLAYLLFGRRRGRKPQRHASGKS